MNIPRSRRFWSVALGHMTNDIFMSMGPVLLAFLSGQVLAISNTQIGAAISAQQLTGAISQPIFGWLADRGGRRWQRMLGAGGILWTVSFLLLSLALAMTGRFWLMIVPYALAAVGSGAFHPVGTMQAAEINESHAASNLSFFFLAGQGGLALGPALAGTLLDWANPVGVAAVSVTPIYMMGLIVLPVAGFMRIAMPGLVERASVGGDSATADSVVVTPLADRAAVPVRALLLLAAVVLLRSLAQPGSVAFIPRLFQQKGWDPTEYGLITSSFWLASGFTGVLFGQLADRIAPRFVIAGSLILAVPALFFLPLADARPLAFGLAIAAGGMTGGSHSVIVAMAHRLLPASKGLASGLTLGFLFGSGAVGSFLIGTLADSIGLAGAFQLVAVAALLSGLLVLFLKEA